MAEQGPTILSYTLREQIGTGSTCTIWRALNPSSSKLVAVKIVALPSFQLGSQATEEQRRKESKHAMKEFRIQETLKHLNVLGVEGGVEREADMDGRWKGGLYIVMQLALGGDLFDKIAPDFGVGNKVSHMFFKQLINGLVYISSKGICHRDIKPENCLVDGDGNLKIADFGLAAVYKYKGVEKMLKDRCGSPPYAAPELGFPNPYKAEPIDVWSAGILLFTLLAGNTPWDEPTQQSPEFDEYLAGTLIEKAPWDRIDPDSKSLLLSILNPTPSLRPTLQEIIRHPWVMRTNEFLNVKGECMDGLGVSREMLRSLREAGQCGEGTGEWQEAMDLLSQPAPTMEAAQQRQEMVFSQHGLDPGASWHGSFKLYSKTSQLPSQRSNPSPMCFFTFEPLPRILSILTSILTSLEIKNALIPNTVPTSYVGRIRFSLRDKRGEIIDASLVMEVDVMPTGKGGGGGMDVDMDVGSANGTGAEEGDEGFVVRLMKHQADPLELKRVWNRITEKCPVGMIYET